MKKSKSTLYICLIALCVVVVAVVLIVTLSKKTDWTPYVQGSHVTEMPYEEIDSEYTVEKFADFNSFSKSQWADYNFISQAKAKDERYSDKFFKDRDLIIIKFNKPEKGVKFTVTDLSVNGNVCTATLLPVKRVAEVKSERTTYCCFVETTVDVSALEVKLSFLDEVLHDSQSFSYTSADNTLYTFENQTEPVVFIADNRAGIDQFFENDGVLSKQSLVYASLRLYKDEVFNESSLALIRLPSSDVENLAVYYKGNTLYIVGTHSNHYLFENETKHHKLVALLVPKDFGVKEIVRTTYYEYEDGLTTKYERSAFALSKTDKLADNLDKYTFVKEND